MTKIALLSDIHGNTTALEAVLADARQIGVDEYWLLGDILMPGTGRRRILDLLDQLPITARVLGNWEDSLGMVSVRNWTVLAPVNAISCASASMF